MNEHFLLKLFNKVIQWLARNMDITKVQIKRVSISAILVICKQFYYQRKINFEIWSFTRRENISFIPSNKTPSIKQVSSENILDARAFVLKSKYDDLIEYRDYSLWWNRKLRKEMNYLGVFFWSFIRVYSLRCWIDIRLIREMFAISQYIRRENERKLHTERRDLPRRKKFIFSTEQNLLASSVVNVLCS